MSNRGTMRTFSGVDFNIEDPRIVFISIKDIAESLSKQCRFNGHCKGFYSVAEHSLHVAKRVSEPNKLWGLLHDAAEAYIGDIISPLKHHLRWINETETLILKLIAQKYSLPWPVPQEVKIADMRMYDTEARDLMGADGGQPYPEVIVTIEDWRLVKGTFLHTFFQNYGG